MSGEATADHSASLAEYLDIIHQRVTMIQYCLIVSENGGEATRMTTHLQRPDRTHRRKSSTPHKPFPNPQFHSHLPSNLFLLFILLTSPTLSLLCLITLRRHLDDHCQSHLFPFLYLPVDFFLFTCFGSRCDFWYIIWVRTGWIREASKVRQVESSSSRGRRFSLILIVL